MKTLSKLGRILGVAAVSLLVAGMAGAAPTEAEMKTSVETYFADLFARMARVAEKKPTEKTFRTVVKPEVENLEGFYSASFIDADWTIRQVYSRRDFLAVGYSLKKVSELDAFREKMAADPAPQLSEPSNGGLLQPSLISMRHPIIADGRMTNMVSVIVRTETFLEKVHLDTCQAYRITCLGKEAESKGTLTDAKKEVKLSLPSTEWIIQYE